LKETSLKTTALAAIAAALSLGGAATAAPAQGPLRVVQLDVEGGGGVLFLTPEGRSVLVDTGWPPGMPAPAEGVKPERSSADVIIAAAQKLGIRQIDYLIISHYHTDHIGGAVEFIKRFPVANFIDHGDNTELPAADRPVTPTHASRTYAAYLAAIGDRPRRVVKPGDTVDVGSLKLTVVTSHRGVLQQPLPGAGGATPGCAEAGEKDAIGGEENPRSVGFIANFGKSRILHLADVTWNVEKELVCPTDKIGPVDLMIASHHGSDLSNSPPLLAAAKPRVVLVGNGARKGGDEPVLQRLRAVTPVEAIWQVHSATRSPQADVDEVRVANLQPQPDANYSLVAEVAPDGAITVVNERNNQRQRYAPSR